jgi:hypothetical protein
MRGAKPYTVQEVIVAFWSKVDRSGGSDACWMWTGARVPAGGYGRFKFGPKLIAAHRAAYILANGEIPDGLDIMHLCDCPPCCNPAHLKAATTAENMADAKAKGRMKAASRKLTPEQANEILSLKGVKRAVDVAADFNVTLSTIHSIWTGVTWKQLREAA